jgi:hypothetical protein
MPYAKNALPCGTYGAPNFWHFDVGPREGHVVWLGQRLGMVTFFSAWPKELLARRR